MTKRGSIVSDNQKVSRVIEHYVLKVISEGGYINPNLVFVCNQTKPSDKGILSLAGVEDGTLALHIPPSVNIEIGNGKDISEYKRSEWYKVYVELGYDKRDKPCFFSERCWEGVISPLADMANDRRDAGRWAGSGGGVWLYGSEVRY
jgi:hypothetical protein